MKVTNVVVSLKLLQTKSFDRDRLFLYVTVFNHLFDLVFLGLPPLSKSINSPSDDFTPPTKSYPNDLLAGSLYFTESLTTGSLNFISNRLPI